MKNAEPTNTFSWKMAALLAVVVGLLFAGLSIFLQTHVRYVLADAQDQDLVMPIVQSPIAQGPGTSFEVPSRPFRLIIPAIGVDAKIQQVGLSWRGTGDMGVPTNFTDVAWYKDGPRPGMPGSAVIDGHFDGKDVAKAVFYDLNKLAVGDVVRVIDTKGKELEFRVVKIEVLEQDADAAEVFSSDASASRLNLITCAGAWDKTANLYSKRIVVFTELVS